MARGASLAGTCLMQTTIFIRTPSRSTGTLACAIFSTFGHPWHDRRSTKPAQARFPVLLYGTAESGCGKIPKISFRARGLPEESAFFLGLAKKQIPRFARDDIKLHFSAASEDVP